MSMLVLHPNTCINTPGAPVEVAMGVSDGAAVFVLVAVGDDVGIAGVAEALAAPMTAGVAVKTEGVMVEGRKGVGMGSG
jgi:hypothetical protein